MKRFIALMLSITALLGALSGCGESRGNLMGDIDSMAEEDMPYGSTMRELKDTPITICYDRRYLNDEAMKKVADYFHAVQTDDEKLFRSVSEENYLKYVEEQSGQSTIDYLKGVKANEEAAIGTSFKYNYIEVTDCKKKGEDTKINEIIKLMDQIYTDGGKEAFSGTVRNAYALEVAVTSDANGSSYTNQSNVYVFECESGTYIFN